MGRVMRYVIQELFQRISLKEEGEARSLGGGWQEANDMFFEEGSHDVEVSSAPEQVIGQQDRW